MPDRTQWKVIETASEKKWYQFNGRRWEYIGKSVKKAETRMVASVATVQSVYNILRKHVPPEKLARLIDELTNVPGNQSFRETVMALANAHIQAVINEQTTKPKQ